MDTDRLLSDNTNVAVPPYQYGVSQPGTGIPNEEVHENASENANQTELEPNTTGSNCALDSQGRARNWL